MGAVLTSLLLGLRQLADPRVIRVLVKSLVVSLILFAIVAVGGWYALDAALNLAGLSDTLFAGAEQARGLLSLILAMVGLWLAWRIVAMAVIQFYADEVVLAVEQRSYPQAALTARDLPVAMQLRQGMGSALRALLVNLAILPFALLLLATGVGTALLFWLANALLLGRELQDMVWLRHRPAPGSAVAAQAAPFTSGQRFLLGGAVAALLMVPGINFLAPMLGAAGATHLLHRRRES